MKILGKVKIQDHRWKPKSFKETFSPFQKC